MFYLMLFLSLLIGYILGSIPNGVLVGLIFFHKDIRKEGSKSSGGTNAGRVLGKKFGLIVIILDLLKSILSVYLVYIIAKYAFKNQNIILTPTQFTYFSSFMTCLGHCYPIFAGFKGGKAVACFAGLVIAYNYILALIGIILYFLILKISKYVSLTSIITTFVIACLFFIPIFGKFMMFSLTYDYFLGILFILLALLVFIKHTSNIKRLINHQESKIKWMK